MHAAVVMSAASRVVMSLKSVSFEVFGKVQGRAPFKLTYDVIRYTPGLHPLLLSVA